MFRLIVISGLERELPDRPPFLARGASKMFRASVVAASCRGQTASTKCTISYFLRNSKGSGGIDTITRGLFYNVTGGCPMSEKAIVAIMMGSQNDYDKVEPGIKILKDFGVAAEVRVLSAHRTPDQTKEFVLGAEKDGVKVFICAAGMAAHLAGVVASHTTRPVIGLPIASGALNGIDSLYSTVMMPPGIPVATVAVNGAQNAAYLALEILQDQVEGLSDHLKNDRKKMAEKVLWADKNLGK